MKSIPFGNEFGTFFNQENSFTEKLMKQGREGIYTNSHNLQTY